DVLAPAIRLAEEGFPVAPLTAYFWGRGAERQLRHAPGGEALMLDGRAPRAGEIFRNPALGRTLRAIAEGGKDEFYRGEIAGKIVEVLRPLGGLMTAEDLAGHTSTWEQPVSTVYRGVRVYECPPNGQGLAALLALNVLSELELPAGPLSAARLHLVVEALRLAFADTRWYVADPAYEQIPIDELLSTAYSRERAALIDSRWATLDQRRGTPVAGSGTV